MTTTALFLRVSDFVKIYNLSYIGALYRYRLTRDALGKTKKQLITYNELAKYEGISVDEITKHLK